MAAADSEGFRQYSGLGQAFGAVGLALAASHVIAEVRSAKHSDERLAGIGYFAPISHRPTIQSTCSAFWQGQDRPLCFEET
jgi:hypothetical protein